MQFEHNNNNPIQPWDIFGNERANNPPQQQRPVVLQFDMHKRADRRAQHSAIKHQQHFEKNPTYSKKDTHKFKYR